MKSACASTSQRTIFLCAIRPRAKPKIQRRALRGSIAAGVTSKRDSSTARAGVRRQKPPANGRKKPARFAQNNGALDAPACLRSHGCSTPGRARVADSGGKPPHSTRGFANRARIYIGGDSHDSKSAEGRDEECVRRGYPHHYFSAERWTRSRTFSREALSPLL